MNENESSDVKLQRLEEERKHLETLFADRINFYLVFAAGVMAFLFEPGHPKNLELIALGAVTAVSLFMILALVRTYTLVMNVLHDVEKYKDAPYAIYSKRSWLPNANYTLLGLPIALTCFFIYALVETWCGR